MLSLAVSTPLYASLALSEHYPHALRHGLRFTKQSVVLEGIALSFLASVDPNAYLPALRQETGLMFLWTPRHAQLRLRGTRHLKLVHVGSFASHLKQ